MTCKTCSVSKIIDDPVRKFSLELPGDGKPEPIRAYENREFFA